MDQIKRQTLTVTQVAQLLGISRNTAYEAVRRGEIPSCRFGRRIVVPIDALGKLINESVDETLRETATSFENVARMSLRNSILAERMK